MTVSPSIDPCIVKGPPVFCRYILYETERKPVRTGGTPGACRQASGPGRETVGGGPCGGVFAVLRNPLEGGDSKTRRQAAALQMGVTTKHKTDAAEYRLKTRLIIIATVVSPVRPPQAAFGVHVLSVSRRAASRCRFHSARRAEPAGFDIAHRPPRESKAESCRVLLGTECPVYRPSAVCESSVVPPHSKWVLRPSRFPPKCVRRPRILMLEKALARVLRPRKRGRKPLRRV